MAKFLNSSEDIAWLKDVHIGDIKPEFESFVLHGNEDAPDQIELFRACEPLYTDKPLAVFYLYRMEEEQ